MATTHVPTNTARETTAAAAAFLPTLGADKLERATLDFEDSDERTFWHYTPIKRKGLIRGDMDGAQLEAAEGLLASGLSEEGLRQARAIIHLEPVLGRLEGDDGIERFDRTSDLYYWSVFGEPRGVRPWGWRVEGHHLSLHYTIGNGETVSATPSFFGANPAEVRSGPDKGLRILRDEEELGRELLLNLDRQQRDRATLYPVAPADLITRASRRVEIDQPAGLPADAMSDRQRQILLSLIMTYVEKKPDDMARIAMKRIQDGFGDIHFGWAGSEHRWQGHYYRIHGPACFIEYDNTQNGANHIHSVWRDVEGDFGYDALGAHYAQHHH